MHTLLLLLIISFLTVTEQLQQEEEKIDLTSKSTYVLPLILIQNGNEFLPPTYIANEIKIKSHQSALMGNTDFRRENQPGKTVFFCPAGSKYEKKIEYLNGINFQYNENCLFETTFRKSKELRCQDVATPIIIKYEDMNEEGTGTVQVPCGRHSRGFLYGFAYQLCIPLNNKEKNEYNMKAMLFMTKEILPCSGTTYFELYKFCYDRHRKTTLYTEHEVISPTLYAYDEAKYDSMKLFEMMTDGYEYFDTEDFKQQKMGYENQTSDEEQIPQKLVPSDHLFFALWRKATFHYANVRPLNKRLLFLWHKVTKSILKNSISMTAHTHKIFTGAFQFRKQHQKKKSTTDEVPKFGPIPDIWICMVIQYPTNHTSSTATKAVAVIMSNHIGISKNTKDIINSYCGESSCKESLIKKFDRVGGYIRCCSLTKDIQKFFGFKFDITETLHIHKLNIQKNNNFKNYKFENPIR